MMHEAGHFISAAQHEALGKKQLKCEYPGLFVSSSCWVRAFLKAKCACFMSEKPICSCGPPPMDCCRF